MKGIRWAAAAVIILMSLMNVGVLFSQGSPAGLVVFGVVVGLLGFAAAYGLVRGAAWGRTAGVAVGAVNLIGAVVAMVTGTEGGVIGLVISVAILVLSGLSTRSRGAAATPATS